MTGNEYQELAKRTISSDMYLNEVEYHALHGLAAEVGELHGLYQKDFQGHGFNADHAKRELGDILWFVAEYCTSMGWTLEEVMEENIKKLKKRYPEGFSADKSLHRKKGDI